VISTIDTEGQIERITPFMTPTYSSWAPGYNFYDGRGKLNAVLSYAKLRDEAQALARRLSGLGLERGARMALVADTHPDSIIRFEVCSITEIRQPVRTKLSLS
jgi:fatty-acyl-CoA synthase